MNSISKLSSLLCLLALVFFASCGDDENPDTDPDQNFVVEEVSIDGNTYMQIAGTIDSNYTFSSDHDWLLSGGIFVEDGVTLTVEAGTNVYAADDGTVPFLSILQGGKIEANGTASSPIVFTSIKDITGDASPGDWGGIIVNGYANINVGATAEGEGGTGTYGGTDDEDDSGTIRYVRVEYAGKFLGTDNELNGFSFNGVGRETTVEYIQAYKGSDDGIEFFGGAVKVRYAVSSGNQDDSFDWTHGWSGSGQFWVAVQDGSSDRGIEGDNNGDDNTLSPYSEPSISNITLIGIDDGDGDNQGIKLREGTKGQIANVIVTGFPKSGIQVEHDVTLANMNDGSLRVRSARVDTNDPYVATNSDGEAVNNIWEDDDTNSTSGSGLNGYVGTVSENATNPNDLGSWFDESADYVGAVPTGSDWTAGWTRAL